MTRRFHTASRVALAAAALVTAHHASAQVAAPQGAASPEAARPLNEESGIQEVTVTAQRRAQNIQDVPIAVSAFSAADLETRQVTSAMDLSAFVPNLVAINNTGLGTANTYSLRGLQNTESIATFDVPVGTYVDDIYIARQNSNNVNFFDVERVEVLRGPQGTLFGRNTTGGAINVILKKPSNDFGGYVSAGYGRYNAKEIKGSIDIPIVDGKILSKFSGFWTHDDGYVRDLTTGQRLNFSRNYGLRGALRFNISDDVTWDISADYSRNKDSNLLNFIDTNGRHVAYTRLRTDVPLGQILIGTPIGNATAVSTDLANNTLGNKTREWDVTSNFQVHAGENFTLNFITGYRHLFQEFVTDGTDSQAPASVTFSDLYVRTNVGTYANTSVLANDGKHRQFTQEVKLNGRLFDDRLDLTAGFFYFREDNTTDFANIQLAAINGATDILTGKFNPLIIQDRTLVSNTTSYAGYAQGDVHVTDKLIFTAGLRYTIETKGLGFTPNFNPYPRLLATYKPFSTADLIAAGIPTSQTTKQATPRFVLTYKFDPDINVYLSATRGFKGGGVNARASFASQATPFGPETIWSYEAGLRSQFLDHRVRFNLTGFYFDNKHFQLPAGYFDPVTNTTVFLTGNYADFRNYGLESEITVVPVDRLNISWGAGYQDAKYHNVDPLIVAQQTRCQTGLANGTAALISANCNIAIVTSAGTIAKTNRTPHFTSTVSANYTVEFGHGFNVVPSISWQHSASTWISTSNDPRGFQRAFDKFNAGVTLRNVDQGWSLSAECTNCTDQNYVASYLTYPYLPEPARWMLRARYDF